MKPQFCAKCARTARFRPRPPLPKQCVGSHWAPFGQPRISPSSHGATSRMRGQASLRNRSDVLIASSCDINAYCSAFSSARVSPTTYVWTYFGPISAAHAKTHDVACCGLLPPKFGDSRVTSSAMSQGEQFFGDFRVTFFCPGPLPTQR